MEVGQHQIKQWINKDERALKGLYKSLFSILMGICMRYKKDEDEAKFALNMGFVKIINNISKYQLDKNFDGWCKRIMVNHLIDEYRKEKKHKERFTYLNGFESLGNKEAYVLNQADQELDADGVRSLLKILPEMTQKIFNLFALDGYKHREIAEMMSIGEGTSKWHVSYARKMLKDALLKQQKNEEQNG